MGVRGGGFLEAGDGDERGRGKARARVNAPKLALIRPASAGILPTFPSWSRASALDPNSFSFLERSSPENFLDLALKEAQRALEADEVPVGAVIVDMPTGRVIARAHNQRELLQDPTAHAEVVAITQAAAHYGSWRLTQAALFVTLEPCIMCAGAIVLARIPKVYYSADDPKAGAYRSVFEILANSKNNHVPEVLAGIKAAESGELLREFFRKKRLPPTNGRKGPPG